MGRKMVNISLSPSLPKECVQYFQDQDRNRYFLLFYFFLLLFLCIRQQFSYLLVENEQIKEEPQKVDQNAKKEEKKERDTQLSKEEQRKDRVEFRSQVFIEEV